MRIPIDDFVLTLGLEVEATWVRAYPGTREIQGEPEGYEIHAVYWNGKDITLQLTDDDMERLHQILLDNHADTDEDTLDRYGEDDPRDER